MVAGFHVDLFLAGQQWVDDHVQTIGFTQRRNSAAFAIVEQMGQGAFASHLPFTAATYFAQVQMPAGRQHRHQVVTMVVIQDH
ncbi:hypothetical protein D3C75_1173010 [compost metagenome]